MTFLEAGKRWPGRYLRGFSLPGTVFVPYFGASILQNNVFSNQSRGHLSSRYIFPGFSWPHGFCKSSSSIFGCGYSVIELDSQHEITLPGN